MPFVLPILRTLAPDSSTFAEYLFPPLGDVQRLGLVATVVFLLLIMVVVFACCPLTRRLRQIVFAILLVGFGVGVCALIALYVPYLFRRVAVPSINQEVSVLIGYERQSLRLKRTRKGNGTIGRCCRTVDHGKSKFRNSGRNTQLSS